MSHDNHNTQGSDERAKSIEYIYLKSWLGTTTSYLWRPMTCHSIIMVAAAFVKKYLFGIVQMNK